MIKAFKSHQFRGIVKWCSQGHQGAVQTIEACKKGDIVLVPLTCAVVTNKVKEADPLVPDVLKEFGLHVVLKPMFSWPAEDSDKPQGHGARFVAPY